MTKRERFQHFLENKPVDRVPVAFFHHFCRFEDFGKGVDDDAILEQNIEGHRRALAAFDPDVAKIMNDSLMLMPVDASFVETPADLYKIKPLSMDSKFVQRTLELTRRVKEIYSSTDAPLYATGFSPSLVLRNSLATGGLPGAGGDESKLTHLLAQDPEAVAAAVKTLSEGIIQLNQLLLTQGGVDGIYLSVNNQCGFFPDDIYLSHIAPWDKAVLTAANELSSMNLLHICGFAGRANNLNLFTGFEAAAYNWAVHAEGVSLAEGKKLFGGKPVFGGFEQDGVIYTGSREEVEKATFRILEDCGQTGIMLGADCTVPTDIEDHRLEWVRQAAIAFANK